jgi:hypothetical protein
MKNGVFEPGDRVDHRTLGYVGSVAALYADGQVACTSPHAKSVDAADLTMVNDGAIQRAFDFGFKAAGGTMIPDEARNMVELAIDRKTIDELAALVDGVITKSPGLRQFLENVSIYRSRK